MAATYTWVGGGVLGAVGLIELLILVALTRWCWLKRDLERTLDLNVADGVVAGP
jgi:hypothetical protein